MAAPKHIAEVLEFVSARVLETRDANLFIGDEPMEEIALSTSPIVLFKKTGGTTKHRGRGLKYIHYELHIHDLGIAYDIYIQPAADDAELNRAALARAIRWFIANYNGGTTFSRDESAFYVPEA